MIKKVQKRFLFLVGVIITGLLSSYLSHTRSGYSKDDSVLFTSTAHADVPARVPSGSDSSSYACFAEGVMVSTPDGDKEIQNLKKGDIVYGFDTVTGVIGAYPITQTFKHDKSDPSYVYSPLLKISYEGGVITITDNHWVYRKNDRVGDFANFDRAGMLKIDDVLTLEDGKEAKILNIEAGPHYESVYNLQVDGVHTYFADKVRVHNDDGGDGAGAGDGAAGGGGGASFGK